MGKKQLIFVEFDVETGDADIRYYGMTSRGDAMRILRKIQQNLGRSLMGGFHPDQLGEPKEVEVETVEPPIPPQEAQDDGERTERQDGEQPESGSEFSGGSEPEPGLEGSDD